MAAFECADLIRFHPQVALAYGDYDHVNGMGERAEPRFLPAWDADLFWATGYPRGALLVRADLDRTSKPRRRPSRRPCWPGPAAHEASAPIHHIPRSGPCSDLLKERRHGRVGRPLRGLTTAFGTHRTRGECRTRHSSEFTLLRGSARTSAENRCDRTPRRRRYWHPV